MAIEAFLVGVIATAAIVAALFFLRFWRDTHDGFFLAFSVSFAIEAAYRVIVLVLPRPNEGSPWLYLLRLLGYLVILFAIVRKNYGRSR